jgi:hypothetical protein
MDRSLKHLTPIQIERFWSKVAKSKSGCWMWTGGKQTGGYGVVSFARFGSHGRKTILAHRLAYRLMVGSIAKGMQIDHLCRVTACVNPAHLEVVTPQVNVLRGKTIVADNAFKSHCNHGHELTPENTYTWKGRPGHRNCKQCRRDNCNKHYRSKINKKSGRTI